MDFPNSSRAAEGTPTVEELQRTLRSLRFALNIALVSMVLLAGSVSIYLFRQVTLLRRQVETAGRTAVQAANHYNVNVLTQAVNFERALLTFSQTNAEFARRMARYFPQASNAPAPSGPPAMNDSGLPPVPPGR